MAHEQHRPFIQGNLRYHETWIDNGDGSWSSAGNQIVITNRIIRRIIEHARAAHGYDPQVRGKELNLRILDDMVKGDDAVRGGRMNSRWPLRGGGRVSTRQPSRHASRCRPVEC
jgi:hypothetical protein